MWSVSAPAASERPGHCTRNFEHDRGSSARLNTGTIFNVIEGMSTHLFNLDGQTAVVIGGTGVLGGAMALALAGCGARVAVVGRSVERGAERLREIEAAGGTA